MNGAYIKNRDFVFFMVVEWFIFWWSLNVNLNGEIKCMDVRMSNLN